MPCPSLYFIDYMFIVCTDLRLGSSGKKEQIQWKPEKMQYCCCLTGIHTSLCSSRSSLPPPLSLRLSSFTQATSPTLSRSIFLFLSSFSILYICSFLCVLDEFHCLPLHQRPYNPVLEHVHVPCHQVLDACHVGASVGRVIHLRRREEGGREGGREEAMMEILRSSTCPPSLLPSFPLSIYFSLPPSLPPYLDIEAVLADAAEDEAVEVRRIDRPLSMGLLQRGRREGGREGSREGGRARRAVP